MGNKTMPGQPIRVTVLVSAGRHPVSLRVRRAINDAQALELGLRLAAAYPVELSVLHAGDAQSAALRSYLGMGVDNINVLVMPAETDILPALANHLRRLEPQLILTGSRAEAGWGSGCLPYFLAQALGWPIATASDDINVSANLNKATIRQVRARGQRRALDVELPAIITVDPAAPLPRQSAFARARNGRVHAITDITTDNQPLPFIGEARPARQQPKRLRVDSAASAADRLKAITEVAKGHGRLTEPTTPADAARLIHQYLVDNDVLKSPPLANR